MIKVLFICHGNICRSTMAEFVLKDMVNKRNIAEEFYIQSAATSREEIGNDTHYGTKNKLDEVGIPYTKRKARQMTKGDYEEYDYIIGMTSREEIGNDTHYGTKNKLDEVGIPYTKRKARQMTKGDYEEYDYIIGMDDANIRKILRIVGGDKEGKVSKLLDWTGIDRSIADPWYTGNFDETYDDVVKGLEAFLEKIVK